MEEQNQTQVTEQENKLEINNAEKVQLNITRKWTYFFAILGFIGIGLIVIIAIVIGFVLPKVENLGALGAVPGVLFSGIYLAFGLLYFFPVLYLFRFSNEMKDAIYNDKQKSFTNSLKNLAKHFRFVGIVTIAILALYLVILASTPILTKLI